MIELTFLARLAEPTVFSDTTLYYLSYLMGLFTLFIGKFYSFVWV